MRPRTGAVGLNVAFAVARRPRLWSTALRQARRTAPQRWWASAPFLPLPAADYMAFRAVTHYGEETHSPEPDDVVAYLQWCRQWERRQPRT